MKQMITRSALLSFLLVAGLSNTYGQGMMSTWVGTGVAGFSGDGGAANMAQINAITDVKLDAAHNLYIADQGNAVIRKVNASTGIITTIAGIGATMGYSGDGGPATSAKLYAPGYICMDAAGNIYIADGGSNFTTGNSTIRKITKATGIITTVAGTGIAGYSGDGGLASAAQIANPKGICIDNAGNLYFADHDNNRIRKITAATGKISTIAGDGTTGHTGDGGPATTAQLSAPIAICMNSAGDIFFSDQGGAYIRKIDHSTGMIYAYAGNGSAFSGDGGPAATAGLGEILGMCTDGHDDIYCDDYSCSCRKINHNTGIINVVAGDGTASGFNGDGVATLSYLSEPAGLCINPATGDIIIADQFNARIRKATQPGYVPTTVGYVPATPHASVFPNPSTGVITLSAAEYANSSVTVFNVAGDMVFSSDLTSNQTTINLTNQPEGVYFLTFSTPNGKEVQNVTITK